MEIKKLDNDLFEVKIDNTIFKVTLTDDYHNKLTNKSKEDLIKASFKFLLDREPINSILKEFNLEVIKKYFEDYEEKINFYLSFGILSEKEGKELEESIRKRREINRKLRKKRLETY